MVLVLSPHKYTVGVWMVALCNVLHHRILIVAVCFINYFTIVDTVPTVSPAIFRFATVHFLTEQVGV